MPSIRCRLCHRINKSAGPIDAVMAIHNAFRADMAGIDAAALAAARGTPGLAATVERFRFFNVRHLEQCGLGPRDELETARATAAFKFHLDIHLAKEDTHLYRIIRERVSVPDQGKAVGVMAGTIPADRNPEFIAWMFPLLGDDDRENMTRVWQMVMPPEVFAGAIQLVHQAIGDDFAELNRRIPELAA